MKQANKDSEKSLEIKPDTSIELVNTLVIIARLLTPMSLELHSLTKLSPSIEQLLFIAYSNFDRDTVVKDVILALTPEGWLAPKQEGIFARESKNRIDFNRTQGRVISMGRVLVNYSPKRWRQPCLDHLHVTSKGIVELPKSAIRAIKAGKQLKE